MKKKNKRIKSKKSNIWHSGYRYIKIHKSNNNKQKN